MKIIFNILKTSNISHCIFPLLDMFFVWKHTLLELWYMREIKVFIWNVIKWDKCRHARYPWLAGHTIRILLAKCSHKSKNKNLFGPILLAVNHRFNIKLQEGGGMLGNVFEFLTLMTVRKHQRKNWNDNSKSLDFFIK